MNEILLTKESEYVLTAMYKEFLDRYNQGVPRDKAKIFGHQDNIFKFVDIFPEQDLTGLLQELKEKSMIIAKPSSNIFYWVAMTTDSIIFMENRVGRNINKIVDWLIKTKQLLF
ncbi:MAG: hypothetical protein ACLSIL_13305 [Enterococcus casseliflavus]